MSKPKVVLDRGDFQHRDRYEAKFNGRKWSECEVYYKIPADQSRLYWCYEKKEYVPIKGNQYKILQVERRLMQTVPNIDLLTIDQDLWNADGYIYKIDLYLEGIIYPLSISCFIPNTSQ
ncbi:MAG: hypothetical protein OXB92_17360 [Acidimicrobiaceae bacterium]|nr:hypothetical protein [Acidimicrobiaceae bacterium]